MFALFDLSEHGRICLTLFDSQKRIEKCYDVGNAELLASFDAFLHEQNVRAVDIEGIAVVVGVGGFTSTRLAAVVANTFAAVHKTPVLAVTPAEAKDTEALIQRLGTVDPGVFIHAQYSAEPNINAV